MTSITTKTSRLSIPEKSIRGTLIISMSTGNPLVPGNEAPLAAFSALQDELTAAIAAVHCARTTLRELVSRQGTIEKRWDQGISQLASFTKFATNSDPTAMLSAGFGIRGPDTPSQPLPAPQDVTASTNGAPGCTKLSWAPVPGAIVYVIQMSPDPITDDGWEYMPVSTRSSAELDGAEPGKHTWFRVAAVNSTGQSSWSMPARRPVM